MCVCAVIWFRPLPQHAYIRMRYAPAPILPACSAAPPFAVLIVRLVVLRLNFSESPMHAKR